MRRKPLPITLDGVQYWLRFEDDPRGPDGQPVDGLCDWPRGKSPRCIRIRSSLRGRRLLQVILHELRHASHWQIDEDVVDQATREEADVLWALGYRLRR